MDLSIHSSTHRPIHPATHPFCLPHTHCASKAVLGVENKTGWKQRQGSRGFVSPGSALPSQWLRTSPFIKVSTA